MRFSTIVLFFLVCLSFEGNERSYGAFYVLGSFGSDEIANDREITLNWKFSKLSNESYSKYKDKTFDIVLYTILEDTLLHQSIQDSSFTFDPGDFPDADDGFFILQVSCVGEKIVSLGMRATQSKIPFVPENVLEEANWYLSDGMNLNAVSVLVQSNMKKHVNVFEENLRNSPYMTKKDSDIPSWRFIEDSPYLITNPPKLRGTKNMLKQLKSNVEDISNLKFRFYVNDECEIENIETLQSLDMNVDFLSDLEISCENDLRGRYQFFIKLVPNKKGSAWSKVESNFIGRN